jgi:bifunctional DNA-binding transcriptional regulator/antitoxin component of YhaV-PrlF toxin-antitoxin module
MTRNITTTLTGKGQLTIPAYICRKLDIGQGQKITVEAADDRPDEIVFTVLRPGERVPYGPATAKIGRMGQITLASQLRRNLGLMPGDVVTIAETADGALMTVPGAKERSSSPTSRL